MDSIDKAGRRWDSKEFKRAAIAACQVPGVSLAAVALEKRINANVSSRPSRQRPRQGLSR